MIEPKSFMDLEKDLLNGQKLQGPPTAEEVGMLFREAFMFFKKASLKTFSVFFLQQQWGKGSRYK